MAHVELIMETASVPFDQRQALPLERAEQASKIDKEGTISDLMHATIITSTHVQCKDADIPIYVKGVGHINPTYGVANIVTVPGNSKIKKDFEFWREHLHYNKDKKFVNEVLHDIVYGVNIGYNGQLVDVEMKNWPSTEMYREEVSSFISKHTKNGSIEVPFRLGDPRVRRTSPLGAFQKTNSQKTRVIHDLSWPVDRSKMRHKRQKKVKNQ